jgi:tetratricopeptide (TPR) repeat protein
VTLQSPPNSFLDVSSLLETSLPRQRIAWMPFVVGGFVTAVFLSWYFGHQGDGGNEIVSFVLTSGLTVMIVLMSVVSVLTVRRARAEQAQLAAIDELVQLRRWAESAMILQAFLSRPARSHSARAQALIYLAMVLTRYHRFEDSVAVHDYILSHISVDDSTGHAIRLGRAMALLREDSLLDADRAIAELRRESRGGESPGLALVEIFRDVKTGHPAEAIEMFEKSIPLMRKHLGHRIADVWGLAARGYEMLGRTDDAKKAFENATLLVSPAELTRRYPEIGPVAAKYPATIAPIEIGPEVV